MSRECNECGVPLDGMDSCDGVCSDCYKRVEGRPLGAPALRRVVSFNGSPLPNETAAQLRALADRMDAGEVPDFTGVYYADETWTYITPGKLTMCAFMAGLLQAAVYKKVFEG